MQVVQRHRQLLIAALASLASLTVYLSPACAQEARKAAESRPLPRGRYDRERTPYIGAFNCKICHQKPVPEYQDRLGFLNLNEYDIWMNHDKHSRAYQVLRNERSKQMGRLLMTVVNGKAQATDVTKDDRCLNCHCINLKEDDPRRSPTFKLEDGVNCEGCHGAAGDWSTPHSADPRWRYTPAEIKATYGMLDVRNPVERARVCSSCHIGNRDEGRWVTHEMYAAGHPPLPSIELATFSHELPNHWKLLREKSPEVKEALKTKLGIDPEVLEHSRLVAVGGATSFLRAMEVLASQAGAIDAQAKDPRDRLLDFAQFDCTACHHDLKSESWRRDPARAGRPGRVPLRSWPSVLAEVGQRLSPRPSGELASSVDKLHLLFDARPYAYGNSKQVAELARELKGHSDTLAQELAKLPYDQATAHRLLHELCAVALERPLDYDSARQVAWAVTIIYREDIQPKPANDSAVQELLEGLSRELKLRLPSGTDRQIELELPKALQTMSDYDPAGFREKVASLAKLLPRE